MLKIIDPRYQQLKDVLFNIAKNDTELDNKIIIDKLSHIYSNDFRHKYSKLFAWITDIDRSLDHSLDILIERMERLSEEPIYNDELRKGLFKLNDHINLEISRLNYYKSILKEKDLLLSNTDARIRKLKTKIEDFNNQIMESSDNLKNQVTTILGIFATIVLSFAGGMTFTTSAFNSITMVGIRNVIVLLLLLGVIFIIAVYSLTYVIAKINRIDLRVRWFYIVVFVMLILLFLIYYYLPLK